MRLCDYPVCLRLCPLIRTPSVGRGRDRLVAFPLLHSSLMSCSLANKMQPKGSSEVELWWWGDKQTPGPDTARVSGLVRSVFAHRGWGGGSVPQKPGHLSMEGAGLVTDCSQVAGESWAWLLPWKRCCLLARGAWFSGNITQLHLHCWDLALRSLWSEDWQVPSQQKPRGRATPGGRGAFVSMCVCSRLCICVFMCLCIYVCVCVFICARVWGVCSAFGMALYPRSRRSPYKPLRHLSSA